ncbi:bifunctional 4-hydroxy-3-methylbut-2-enyl diphosphate reductase/30S ribosomal protein S1 [Gottschalkiaceae bacterium SANA]|nr:bifunctional 4-hydroxy-3-methylbut-2-enyl diphosphate reductase/30S ribosomal protein S1 [Gottschalkiaceae bacterium SANA]
MKIKFATTYGFCFGVKRSMELADAETGAGKSVCTYGPLIHNEQVIKDLQSKGIERIESLNEILDSYERVIIRSHGISHAEYQQFIDSGLDVIDATCPFVKKIHQHVQTCHKQGQPVIIIGDAQHKEVIGINGWCENQGFIIDQEEQIDELPDLDHPCVVAQTTFSLTRFNSILKKLKSRFDPLQIHRTICAATEKRQNACIELAKTVDALLVIGGKNSSNTKKLVEIGGLYCPVVFHIETAQEIPFQDLSKYHTIGITAGASTPDWITKEVLKTLNQQGNEQTMQEMMEEMEKEMQKIYTRAIVTGSILSVSEEGVLVNIGYKSDALIPKNELSFKKDVLLAEQFNVGDEIEAVVVNMNDGEGNVVLSTRRLAQKAAWKKVKEFQDADQSVMVTIDEVNKGGLVAYIEGLRAYMPASQLSVSYVKDLAQYLNQEIEAKIIELNPRKNRIILSHKVIEEVIMKAKADAFWATLEKEQKIVGKVKKIMPFGVFVELGGVDGLIHISDLSWGKIKHPKEVLTVGDDVETIVLDFNRETNRISLGYKQLIPHPWDNIEEKYVVGQVYEGKVARFTDFGAFIELTQGVDGLVHISQIAYERINKVSDVLEIAQMVNVKVLSVDSENHRISLSIKETLEKPERPERPERPAQDSKPKRKRAPKRKEEKFESYTSGDDSEITIGDLFKDLDLDN